MATRVVNENESAADGGGDVLEVGVDSAEGRVLRAKKMAELEKIALQLPRTIAQDALDGLAIKRLYSEIKYLEAGLSVDAQSGMASARERKIKQLEASIKQILDKCAQRQAERRIKLGFGDWA